MQNSTTYIDAFSVCFIIEFWSILVDPYYGQHLE